MGHPGAPGCPGRSTVRLILREYLMGRIYPCTRYTDDFVADMDDERRYMKLYLDVLEPGEYWPYCRMTGFRCVLK